MTIVLILFYLTYLKEYSFIIRTPFQNWKKRSLGVQSWLGNCATGNLKPPSLTKRYCKTYGMPVWIPSYLMICNTHKLYIPGFLKTGLAKISTNSTSWQFKTRKLVQRPIKSLYLTPGRKLMVPRSIPTSPNLKWCKF